MLFNDSKDFVDSPLLVTPDECWSRWNALQQPVTRDELVTFVAETFGPPGHDLEPWAPPDYQESPPLLSRLPEGAVRDWAKALNDLWPVLGRQLSATTRAQPSRTTLLPMRHGFIVPGGRFREAYYWDTYWVVLGLLAVGMRATATSVTDNLLDAARAYGFVPNGLRSYYLNRSQPPLLTQMVAAIVDAEASAAGGAEMTLLDEALPVLDAEYEWWMREGANASAVHLAAREGRPAATLNRYAVGTDAPRPESWREDVATAAAVAAEARPSLYAQLAAGAESGWDYSSRWLPPKSPPSAPPGAPPSAPPCDVEAAPLCGIRTSDVLAVELNAILYRNERTLHRLHARRAELRAAAHDAAHDAAAAAAVSAKYAAAAAARRRAMDGWMWSSTEGRWHDVDLRRGEALKGESAASYTPLWAGACDDAQAEAAVAALRGGGLLQSGGLATTLEPTGQQWDWPNAWPPLQQMAVEGLARCGARDGAKLAAELAGRWLHSTLLGWTRDGVMHEKMDASRPGERGGGGEYTPQVGFGWSNGVVLWMLERGYTPIQPREKE